MYAFFWGKTGRGLCFVVVVVCVCCGFLRFFLVNFISVLTYLILHYFHSDRKLSKLCFDITLDFKKKILYAKQKCHTFVTERNCCYIYEVRKHT